MVIGFVWRFMACALMLPSGVAGEAGKLVSVAELERIASGRDRALQSFRLEGVVCALLPDRKWLVLQDSSATALFEVGVLDPALREGDRIAIVAQDCAISENRFAIQLGTAAVVNLDGLHSAASKSGSVFLTAGLQPIRLVWFNGQGAFALKVEYESKELPRQRIPDHVLWRTMAENPGDRATGLDFETRVTREWTSVTDFARSTFAGRGVARNFDTSYSARRENAGVMFTGFLEIPRSGIYTFHVLSDDGAQLTVGDPAKACEILRLGESAAPDVEKLSGPFFAKGGPQWVEAQGTVMFAAKSGGDLELDLAWNGERLRVTVLDGASLFDSHLASRRVSAKGICKISQNPELERSVRLLAPGPENITLLSPDIEGVASTNDSVLNTAEGVRRLSSSDAERKLPVKIEGVVTWASPASLMLQDATGGAFVILHLEAERPAVGDRWEIEGHTARGDYAPILIAKKMRFLGYANTPEPVPATWEQLMNGALDMQYVEIQGVLTAASNKELTILMRGGAVKIRNHPYYPLPRSLSPASRAIGYLGSVLRIRGALSVEANTQTREAVAGVIRLGAAQVCIDEPKPADPFSIPTKKAADLLLYDPLGSLYRPLKLAGQIIFARPREYFLLDDKTGVRLLTKDVLPLSPGDRVEAVGLPKMGGPSLVLQESEIRKMDKAKMPEPVIIQPKDLLDRVHDATLVQVEATLLEDASIQDERVLELQSGPYRFAGRLAAFSRPWKALLPGSRLLLTGVYSWEPEHRGPEAPDGFELLLNGPQSIAVLQAGPWWTKQRIIGVGVGLLVALVAAAVWIALLQRKIEERAVQLRKEIGGRQLAEQRRVVEQERARVAQDLHDELGAGITEMGILGALARNPEIPTTEKESYLDRLTESARTLVTGLDEIVWAINPQYDSLASLATYFSFFAERFLSLGGIMCRLRIADELPDFPLDSHVRHDVFLAFKEALNNIVRHSGATEVNLEIKVEQRELRIVIHDNGRGFQQPGNSPGSDGIAGMHRRLLQLGGYCRIASEPGQGTLVEFRLSLS